MARNIGPADYCSAVGLLRNAARRDNTPIRAPLRSYTLELMIPRHVRGISLLRERFNGLSQQPF